METREPKCIPIKFHFINNTDGPSNPRPEITFAQYLEDLNDAYRPARISFTFDGECIHYGTLPISGSTGPAMYDLLTDSLDNLDPHPALAYLEGYLNVYFMQVMSGANYGYFNIDAAVIGQGVHRATLIHEVGHLLGLNHTHNGPISPTLPQSWDCLCKDTTAVDIISGIPHCETTVDCLCDTGIDPWALDIDHPKDSLPDIHKCVVNGNQISSLLPSFPDWCGDTITPWSIPARNYMSYYHEDFQSEFSPCQSALMHDYIDSLKPYLILSPCSPTEALSCPDIIIDTEVTWTDTVIYMCKNQRIRITKTGSLLLDNTIITMEDGPEPPSISCPDLVPQHLWGGILIEGKSVVNNAPFEPLLLGTLNVTNGSLLEYATVAIQAPVRFGRVVIDNSLIRQCGQLMDLRDAWPYTFPGEESTPFAFNAETDTNLAYCGWAADNPPPIVRIFESSLSCDPLHYLGNRPNSQVKASGVSLYIQKSVLKNQTPFELTAINQARGRLSIMNQSKISGFDIGVAKGIDIFTPCINRGLVVLNSDFEDCRNSISNHSALMRLEGNYIEGVVSSEGLCYQQIKGNKLLSSLRSTAPMEASIITENYFDESSVEIFRDNSHTNLLCNTWDNVYAVDIMKGPIPAPTLLPLSWGNMNSPSGNRHEGPVTPIMSNYEPTEPKLKNYALDIEPTELFEYIAFIEPGEAIGTGNCSYTHYPDSLSEEITPIDFVTILDSLNLAYLHYDTLLNGLENQLGTLSGNSLIQRKEIIEQGTMQRGLHVGDALLHLAQADSTHLPTWLARVNTRLIELSNLSQLWYRGEIDSMMSALAINTDIDAEILYNALACYTNLPEPGQHPFALNTKALDSLTVYANASFGDYTNLLRSFLAAEYDIHIPWPEPVIVRGSSRRQIGHQTKAYQPSLVLRPNPTRDCLIPELLMAETGHTYTITIHSLSGQLTYQSIWQNNESICLSGMPSGLYLFTLRGEGSDIHRTLLSIIP